MINYSARQNLGIPITMFFNTVKRVRNYKNFVPWCTDSWELNKLVKNVDLEHIANKYPIFERNKNLEKKVKDLLNKSPSIKTQTFDGGLSAGFNIIDFTYTSHVIAIEPNIVVSLADSSKSNVFQRLESVWILNEDNAEKDISVEYYIDFEFKSKMYSNVTNMFLNFLGDNIMKAFITKCNSDLAKEKLNTNIFPGESYLLTLDNKLNNIQFESPNDKVALKLLINQLYQMGKINIKDIEKLLQTISYNQNALKHLVFLSEMAVWDDTIQIEKIRREMHRNFD